MFRGPCFGRSWVFCKWNLVIQDGLLDNSPFSSMMFLFHAVSIAPICIIHYIYCIYMDDHHKKLSYDICILYINMYTQIYILLRDMGVPENEGSPKPWVSILQWSSMTWMIWGYPHDLGHLVISLINGSSITSQSYSHEIYYHISIINIY